jgi:hypothetical protein
MTQRLGRADLHIHTLASDGTAGVTEILEHVERNTELDVIAITDHERIDAALAARSMARDRGLRFEVVVGEEVTTLGGHLLALWIEEPIKPFRSLRSTIAASPHIPYWPMATSLSVQGLHRLCGKFSPRRFNENKGFGYSTYRPFRVGSK